MVRLQHVRAQAAVLEFVRHQESHFSAVVRVLADQPRDAGDAPRAFFVSVFRHQADLAVIVNEAFGEKPFMGDPEIQLQRQEEAHINAGL